MKTVSLDAVKLGPVTLSWKWPGSAKQNDSGDICG